MYMVLWLKQTNIKKSRIRKVTIETTRPLSHIYQHSARKVGNKSRATWRDTLPLGPFPLECQECTHPWMLRGVWHCEHPHDKSPAVSLNLQTVSKWQSVPWLRVWSGNLRSHSKFISVVNRYKSRQRNTTFPPQVENVVPHRGWCVNFRFLSGPVSCHFFQTGFDQNSHNSRWYM